MQKHFMHTEITALSTGIMLFLGKMGSCCTRTFFLPLWSEEVMNMSLWLGLYKDAGLVFYCFLKDLLSGMKRST